MVKHITIRLLVETERLIKYEHTYSSGRYIH